jgi:hypothetical protein
MQFWLWLMMVCSSAHSRQFAGGRDVVQIRQVGLTIQGGAMYRIESIGRVFTSKTREQLEGHLNAEAQNGWYFHSVFSVTEASGCFGSQKVNTYYMVLTRVQPPHA